MAYSGKVADADAVTHRSKTDYRFVSDTAPNLHTTMVWQKTHPRSLCIDRQLTYSG